jgi:capsule biosynthesis phosphatase
LTRRAIVVDVDGTLCPLRRSGQDYADLLPDQKTLDKLLEYRRLGFTIALFTARNMNTFGNNLGLINARTAPDLIAWLDRHQVPYDELYFGKPWPGELGFYVDDRTVRPDEFVHMAPDDIARLLGDE